MIRLTDPLWDSSESDPDSFFIILRSPIIIAPELEPWIKPQDPWDRLD